MERLVFFFVFWIFLYFVKLLGSVRCRSCKLWNISYFAEKMTKMCTMPRMHLSPWGKWKLQIHVRTRKYNLRKKQYALKRNIIWNSPHLPEFEWSFDHFVLQYHSTDIVTNSRWQLMNKHELVVELELGLVLELVLLFVRLCACT